MNKVGNKIWFAVTMLLVIVLDQISKQYVTSIFNLGDVREVIPNLFNLVLTYNPGVAFGFLGNVAPGVRYILLGITTVIALGVLLTFLVKDFKHDPIGKLAIAGIIGGAIGNIIDRVRYGHVIDFLDFYIKDMHWPAFNIADSAICIGVGIILLRGGAKGSS